MLDPMGIFVFPRFLAAYHESMGGGGGTDNEVDVERWWKESVDMMSKQHLWTQDIEDRTGSFYVRLKGAQSGMSGSVICVGVAIPCTCGIDFHIGVPIIEIRRRGRSQESSTAGKCHHSL